MRMVKQTKAEQQPTHEERPLRIAITGGKTGGHVFPAIAVIEALRQLAATSESSLPSRTLDFLYLGVRDGIEEQVVPNMGIPLSSFHLITPSGWQVLPAAALLSIATVRSLFILRRFRPDVLFSTGGFVSLPATLAARLLRIPIVVYLPDATPGRSVRLSAYLADRIALSTATGLDFLPSAKAMITGYPLRSAFADLDRTAARRHFHLPPDQRVLLVMGGSQGASSINGAIAAGLPRLLELAAVLHVAGPTQIDHLEHIYATLPQQLAERYRLFPFLNSDDIALAMAAADLAITRAGASVIGELPAARLPAILVPYPHARAHQEANATVLVDRGAAIMLRDSEIGNGRLIDLALELLQDDERRQRMAAAAAALSRPNAAREIAQLLLVTVQYHQPSSVGVAC